MKKKSQFKRINGKTRVRIFMGKAVLVDSTLRQLCLYHQLRTGKKFDGELIVQLALSTPETFRRP